MNESQSALSFSTPYVTSGYQPIAQRLPVRACRTHRMVVPSPSPPLRASPAPSRKQRSSSSRKSKSPLPIRHASPPSPRIRAGRKTKGSARDDDDWVPTSAAPRTRRVAQGSKQPDLPQVHNPSVGDKPFVCRYRCGEAFERWTDEVRHIETAACDFIPKEKSQTATICKHCRTVLSRSDACLRHLRDSCRLYPKSKRYIHNKTRS